MVEELVLKRSALAQEQLSFQSSALSAPSSPPHTQQSASEVAAVMPHPLVIQKNGVNYSQLRSVGRFTNIRLAGAD